MLGGTQSVRVDFVSLFIEMSKVQSDLPAGSHKGHHHFAALHSVAHARRRANVWFLA
jgi:hypothetical protein